MTIFYKTFSSIAILICFILFSFTGQAQIDLTLTGFLEPGDDNINSGDRVTVDFTYTNTGSMQANEPRVAFYLSSDNQWDSGDTFLESEELDEVDAGDSEDEEEQFDVYASQAGSYYIIAYIDYNNLISETNENNNYAVMAITVNTGSSQGGGNAGTGAGVDLRLIANLDSPADDTVMVNESIDVEYEVFNDGQNDAGEFRIAFYLSTDNQWDSGDTYLKKDTQDDLESGDSEDDDEEVTIPSTQPGNYFLLVYADDQVTLGEANTSNNLVAIPIVVESSTVVTTRSLRASEALLTLAPNPVREQLTVRFTTDELLGVEVFDLQGKRLYQQHYTAPTAPATLQIATDQWANGAYLIKAHTNTQFYTQTFIKQ